MKQIIYLFAALCFISFISSCSTNSVRFGAKEKYILEEGERQISHEDSVVLQIYDVFNNYIDHQVPLNRFVSGINYKVFFGIAINDKADVMYNLYVNDSTHNLIDYTVEKYADITAYKIFLNKPPDYAYRLIYESPPPVYTIVINIISEDSALIHKFYSDKEFITKKFGYEKN